MTETVDGFDERRHALARAAMEIWSDEGYAQVSVRNVARKTQLGHGLVHYYFKSKDALVAACLRIVGNDLVIGCDFSAHVDGDVGDLSREVAESVVDSFRRHARLHRIRYDLRYQAMFVPELRAHSVHFEAVFAGWVNALRDSYDALGSHVGRRFDLMALQLDAVLGRAVRAHFLGEDLDDLAEALHEDCMLILPTTLS